MSSLFAPLESSELTTLRVRHDWRTGASFACASREWDPALAFVDYRRTFDHETILTSRQVTLHGAATRERWEAEGALQALNKLLELMRQGRHQGVDIHIHPRRPIRFVSNMHSNVLALDNRRHALRAGGIRRHEPEEDELEVLVDGLNLARAMTFKNAAARIPYGGSKICVTAPPISLDDDEALGFLGWCIDRSRAFTGPDMGFVPEHADALRARFTRNIVGGPGGSLGPTGEPTARGVLLALIEAARHHLGRTDGLRGVSLAVQGLGAVGGPLALGALRSGVERLVVADPDLGRVEGFLASLGVADRERVERCDPADILRAEVDILSPNAVGGVLGLDEIAALRCRVVMGAANNQLRAVSRAEEVALARALADRGVLYQIDWMHNTAGVIAGCEEYEHQEGAQMSRVDAALVTVCRDGVRENLVEAAAAGVTPTEMAYQRIESAIYPVA